MGVIYREYSCRCGATATDVVSAVVARDESEPRECHACGNHMAVSVRISGGCAR